MSARSIRNPLVAAFALAASLATARTGHAQVRSDGAIEIGASERFTTGRAPGASLATPGPRIGVRGHLALFPMVRIGAQLAVERSSGDEPSTRTLYSAALRLKFTPPLGLFGAHAQDAWHAWLFTGLGFVHAYDPSYLALTLPDGARAYAAGASENFFEVPLGVGIGWRFRRPYEVTAELFGSRAFLNGGDGPRALQVSGGAGNGVSGGAGSPSGSTLPGAGEDAWALGLSVGIGFDL